MSAGRGTAAGVLVVLALGAGAGCTRVEIGQPWTRPDTGISQMTADEMACARAAQEIDAGPGTYIGGIPDAALYAVQEAQRQSLFERCMTVKGYTRPA